MSEVTSAGDAQGSYEVHRDLVHDHYTKHFGHAPNFGWCDHHLGGELGHLDILVFPPTEERSFLTLATVGMSSRPMATDKQMAHMSDDDDAISNELAHLNFCELILYLPAGWDFGAPDGMTPVTFIRNNATYPFRHKTWLGSGHTIPLDNSQPLFLGSLITHAYLSYPFLEEAFLIDPFDDSEGLQNRDSFHHLELSEERVAHFYWLHGITRPERYLKMSSGSEELDALLFTPELPVLDIDRACMVSTEGRQERRARLRAQSRRLKSHIQPWWKIECDCCGRSWLEV